MRNLRAEEELAEDVRVQMEIVVDEAATVAIWAHLELGRTARWQFLRRRFLERVWRDRNELVDRGRESLDKAAP